jgi:archaellum component FlaF (FlaF/FlaG flagellin family)
MILWKTEQLLNLQLSKELPLGTIKGLFIRYTGTNDAGQTATLANLGTVRVNYKGNDIVNTTVSFFNLFNNLKNGVSEFSSAVGAAFVASIYVPFHAPWDESNGLYVAKGDLATIDLRFSGLSGVAASGVVEVYYVSAVGIANYIPLLINQNIQAGGAGQVVDEYQQFNISALYVTENAAITGQVNVYRDGRTLIQSTQAVLEANSNMMNRVETALAFFEINLNPLQQVANSLSSNVSVNITVNGATTIVVTFLAFLFDDKIRNASAVFAAAERKGDMGIPLALNQSTPANLPLVDTSSR